MAARRRDGISLRMLGGAATPGGGASGSIYEVRLHLLGEHELSWMRGSLSLLEVDAITAGRCAHEQPTLQGMTERLHRQGPTSPSLRSAPLARNIYSAA